MRRNLLEHAPLALLLVALAVGGWLRFTELGSSDLYGDQAEYALVARELRNPFDLTYSLDGQRQIIFVSQPHLALWTMAAFDVVFGPSDVTARAAVAFLGMVGILAAYLLGREAFSPVAGAGAALFLAVTPLHVNLSRQALLEVPFATFAMLATWLTLRWLRTGARRDAAFAGVAAAATVLAKLPGVLVPAALVLFLVAQALRERLHHGSWRAAAAAPAPAVTAALASARGRVDVAVAAATFLAPLALYVLYLGVLGAWDAWGDKLAWQFGRVADGASFGETSKSWTSYLEGPNGLPMRMGPGMWAVGILGVVWAAAAWLAPRRWRATAPRPGDAAILAVALVIFGFFAAADRKVWFYVAPVAPFLVLLGGRAVVATAEAAARFAAEPRVARLHGGARWVRPTLAALVVLAAWTQAAAPALEVARAETQPATVNDWGGNYDEACAFVDARRTDPSEGAFGALLSRYAMRYYCPDLPVFDRFRASGLPNALVAQGIARWLVTDPYYVDPADQALFDGMRASFPHVEVARFGQVRVLEFQPTNVTLALTPTQRGDVVDVRVAVGNPPTAPARNLTGAAANFSVFAYTDAGWPYRIYHELVPLEGPWELAPGAARELTWTWKGQSYWSKDSDGQFHVRLVLANETRESATFVRP